MITSTSNSQIRHVAMLQKKARYRNSEGQFVAEGIKMVLETPPELLSRIYVSEDFQPEKQVRAWLSDKSCEVVSSKVFKELSMTQTPQGILAVVHMSRPTPEEILSSGDCFLILENLQDPGNLGTIIRTAEGAGIDGIFMNKTCVDIYNPKVVRSTMGSLYRVPFVYTDDLQSLIKNMKTRGVRLFAAHLKGKKAYYEENLSGPCAFLIGNEANGLSDETAALADVYIKIPMLGKVESLNAAMAAGILMYEMRRQKATAHLGNHHP